ncbi:MAG: hypothetical protein ABMA64_25525 [Myxococcota bacterium]
MWLTLLACTPPDPQVDAWHRAFEIDAMTRADGDCGSPAVDDVPEEPYLFVAVDRGLPDIASLYWCREPKDCVAPFASVWLRKLTETALEGDLSDGDFDGSLCQIRWDRIVASQQGGKLDLVYETGGSTVTASVDECDAAAEQLLGDTCLSTLTFRGTDAE